MTSYEGLCEILARDYQVAPESLSPEKPLTELEIDSLGIIELIFAIEEKFDVVAEDSDTDSAKDFVTVGDVANYIDRLVARRDAGGEPVAAAESTGMPAPVEKEDTVPS